MAGARSVQKWCIAERVLLPRHLGMLAQQPLHLGLVALEGRAVEGGLGHADGNSTSADRRFHSVEGVLSNGGQVRDLANYVTSLGRIQDDARKLERLTN